MEHDNNEATFLNQPPRAMSRSILGNSGSGIIFTKNDTPDYNPSLSSISKKITNLAQSNAENASITNASIIALTKEIANLNNFLQKNESINKNEPNERAVLRSLYREIEEGRKERKAQSRGTGAFGKFASKAIGMGTAGMLQTLFPGFGNSSVIKTISSGGWVTAMFGAKVAKASYKKLDKGLNNTTRDFNLFSKNFDKNAKKRGLIKALFGEDNKYDINKKLDGMFSGSIKGGIGKGFNFSSLGKYILPAIGGAWAIKVVTDILKHGFPRVNSPNLSTNNNNHPLLGGLNEVFSNFTSKGNWFNNEHPYSSTLKTLLPDLPIMSVSGGLQAGSGKFGARVFDKTFAKGYNKLLKSGIKTTTGISAKVASKKAYEKVMQESIIKNPALRKEAARLEAQMARDAIIKSGGRASFKVAGKKIPLLGLLVGLGLGGARLQEGDWTGAGLEVLSGALGASGVGFLGSLGIDAYLLKRDIDRELNSSRVPLPVTSPIPSTSKILSNPELPPLPQTTVDYDLLTGNSNNKYVKLTDLGIKSNQIWKYKNDTIRMANAPQLKRLHSLLTTWFPENSGYRISYNAAMAGEHSRGSGHYSGDKIDFQILDSGGRLTSLTPAQETVMMQEGYWNGNRDGAQGKEWQKDGGFHYDVGLTKGIRPIDYGLRPSGAIQIVKPEESNSGNWGIESYKKRPLDPLRAWWKRTKEIDWWDKFFGKGTPTYNVATGKPTNSTNSTSSITTSAPFINNNETSSTSFSDWALEATKDNPILGGLVQALVGGIKGVGTGLDDLVLKSTTNKDSVWGNYVNMMQSAEYGALEFITSAEKAEANQLRGTSAGALGGSQATPIHDTQMGVPGVDTNSLMWWQLLMQQ